MNYQLAIFDLDGTLLDTLDDLANSINYACGQHGLPTRTKEEVRRFVGHGITSLVVSCLPNDCDKKCQAEVLDTFYRHYQQHCEDNTHPYEGVIAVLEALQLQGVQLAILSNKVDEAVKRLAEQYFLNLFTLAVGEQQGVPRKPAPDGLDRLCEGLQLSKEQVVYIGDSEVDVMTARNAGIDCIAVDWGFRTKEELVAAGAVQVVSTPDELLQHLLAPPWDVRLCEREVGAVYQIMQDKKRFLPLLLLADEQESMIDRYLSRGEMFLLYREGQVLAVCVVTDEGHRTLELKNIATDPSMQGKGIGKALITFLVEHYRADYDTLLVGTGDSPLTVPFYKACGFEESYRVKNFFTDHYDHPIIEAGVQLVDMVYLKRAL